MSALLIYWLLIEGLYSSTHNNSIDLCWWFQYKSNGKNKKKNKWIVHANIYANWLTMSTAYSPYTDQMTNCVGETRQELAGNREIVYNEVNAPFYFLKAHTWQFYWGTTCKEMVHKHWYFACSVNWHLKILWENLCIRYYWSSKIHMSISLCFSNTYNIWKPEEGCGTGVELVITEHSLWNIIIHIDRI